MFKSKISVSFLLSMFLSIVYVQAQDWVKQMQKPNANFYEIKKSFESHWKNRPYARSQGYKQYKRWEYFWEKRVSPTGKFPLAGIKNVEWDKYLKAHPEIKLAKQLRTKSTTGTWTSLGPNSSPGGYQGVGRINCIEFHPTNANLFYVGTPAGGLWRTTNGGSSWTNLTDDLPIIGVSSIVIHPTNSNILYIATGDADGSDTPSVGVMKSTDGGITWSKTGLDWTMQQGRQISVLLMHPTNANTLIAATSEGIYKTTNGGTTWARKATGTYRDLEVKPGTATTWYATGTQNNGNHQVFLSNNTGESWSQVTNLSGKNRIAIAVSANNPNLVAAVTSNASNNGFGGFYTSTNSGSSFSLKYNSRNLLGWSSTGSDSGGQGWYDLTIAVSPTNANVMHVGGVNNWRSTNGGSSWSINNHWSGAPVTVHADKHFLMYHPLQSNTLFECNDGGVYKTTNGGSSWTDLTNGMAHTQFYKIGVSQSDAGYVVAGAQDNGTKLRRGSSWTNIGGGDGMECIIDPLDRNIQYYSIYYGRITRIMNGSTSTISNNVPGRPRGAWVTPYVLDPSNRQTIIIGYQDVFRSNNRGNSWTNISNGQTGTDNLNAIAVAPSSSNTIYAASYTKIYRTTNASSWTDITAGLPSGPRITYIAVSSSDPNTLWVTLSGYTSGQKVFKSINGGSSWTNISGTLPNLPINCVLHDSNTSNESLYIGTDVGIFYRNNTLGDWVSFSNGLPNVVVRELEIQHSSGKLRAGTYGRGLWESDLYSGGGGSGSAPTANFSASATSVLVGQSVTFTDVSSGSPTSRSWSFTGGSPATSTAQNPTVTYNTPGTYAVSLTVSNAQGSDTKTVPSYIVVTQPTCTYCAATGTNTSYEYLKTVQLGSFTNTSNDDNGYGDYTGQAIQVTAGQSYSVTLTPGFTGSSYTEYYRVWIDYNKDCDFNDPGELVFSGSGSSSVSGNITIANVTASTRMRVSIKYQSASGNCGSFTYGEVEDYTINITNTPVAPQAATRPVTELENTAIDVTLFPNPTQDFVGITTQLKSHAKVEMTVRNSQGQPVMSRKVYSTKGALQEQLDVKNLPAGIYLMQISINGKMVTKRFVIGK
ncbi:hypothetical protein BKI52_25740 [marine bacterium AO1-C]|nr:hypothetical protein BKI52_25740 [marine bacterium AO1-C]